MSTAGASAGVTPPSFFELPPFDAARPVHISLDAPAALSARRTAQLPRHEGWDAAELDPLGSDATAKLKPLATSFRLPALALQPPAAGHDAVLSSFAARFGRVDAPVQPLPHAVPALADDAFPEAAGEQLGETAASSMPWFSDLACGGREQKLLNDLASQGGRPSLPAPAHDAAAVLASAALAMQTHASAHFAWDAQKATFVWALTLQRARSRSAPSWSGGEHVQGLSAQVSKSLLAPFLQIGTLRRRIAARIGELRELTDAGAAPTADVPEACALAAALESVMDWLGAGIDARPPPLSLFVAGRGLEDALAVLKSIADVLGCGLNRRTPFPPMLPPDANGAVPSNASAMLQTRVYLELAAQLSSYASPLPAAALSHLLEEISAAWRTDVAAWIGWPGVKPKDESTVGEKGKWQAWAGVEVEWEKDVRGEVDVGYVLRPARLPAFLPLSCARDLLEAGRSLRLLRKAAPPSHPVLVALADHSAAEALSLPTWTWDEEEASEQLHLVKARVARLRRAVARWRRERGEVDQTALPSSEPVDSAAIDLQHPALATSDAPSFDEMLAVFNALPPAFETDEAHNNTPGESPQTPRPRRYLQGRRKAAFLERIQAQVSAETPDSQPAPPLLPQRHSSIAALTQATLIDPMLEWTQLLNSSLISSFYRDLGLATYLETCRRFLLFGSTQFRERVAETLFEGPEGADIALTSWAPGLSTRLNEGSVWPPKYSEIASALNYAVMETVAEMRADDAARGDDRGLVRPETLALRDLDDRLSFAIVKPESVVKGKKSSGAQSRWRDRNSIDALDWLTLSFHPPPLIAPLLPINASIRYQRLFNFLLRLMRVQTVLGSLFRDAIKGARVSRPGSCKDDPAETSWPFQHDMQARETLLRFRAEANHVVSALNGFVLSAIDDGWQHFQTRLSTLCRDAEARDDSAFGKVQDSDVALAADDDDAKTDAGTMADYDGENAWPARQGETQSLEIKDVFSLARFHESTLERMLQTCFLRARQRGLRTIIDEILDGVLKLAMLCRDERRSAADENAGAQEAADHAERLYALYGRWRSRVHLLVRALELVRDKGEGSTQPMARSRQPAESSAGERGTAARIEAERMERQAEEDLRRLAGEEAQIDTVAELLVRLDLNGHFSQ